MHQSCHFSNLLSKLFINYHYPPIVVDYLTIFHHLPMHVAISLGITNHSCCLSIIIALVVKYLLLLRIFCFNHPTILISYQSCWLIIIIDQLLLITLLFPNNNHCILLYHLASSTTLVAYQQPSPSLSNTHCHCCCQASIATKKPMYQLLHYFNFFLIIGR